MTERFGKAMMVPANFNVDGSLKHFLALEREQRALELEQHSAIIGLSQEVDACFEWIEATLEGFVQSKVASCQKAYVHLRIPEGSVYNRDMLEPEIGIWLTAPSDQHAVLVWTGTAPGFTVYSDVERDPENVASYRASIEHKYDISEPRTPYSHGSIEKWASGILVMASTLQRAIENLS